MDLTARLEQEFLPFVNKPARYLGNEHHVVAKKLSDVKLRIALCYPAIYEQGMADAGFEILYYVLNSHPAMKAERCFLPSEDAIKILHDKDLPLFSLESKTALNEFQVVLFTLRSALQYCDLLRQLEMGGIIFRAADRTDIFPLILGGGIPRWNPEPIADFLDVAVIGNWENKAFQLSQLIFEAQHEKQSKSDLLKKLSKIKGAYIPVYYQATYNDFGAFESIEKNDAFFPDVIEAGNETDMNSQESYSVEPLFPLIRTNDSMTEWKQNIPLEASDKDELFSSPINAWFRRRLAESNSRMNGIYLMGNDDPSPIWKEIKEQLFQSGHELQFSFPDFRIENSELSFQQLEGLKEKELRIFAGAGSQRLRTLMNQFYRDADLYRLLELVIGEGWTKIRLDFLIGLPQEKDEDITSLIQVIHKCKEICPPDKEVDLAIGIRPFILQPFTMFQWEGFDSRQKLEAKYLTLRQNLNLTETYVIFEDISECMFLAALNRGDRSYSQVIESACRSEATVCAEKEEDLFQWDKALDARGVTWKKLLEPFSVTVPLPWDHIDYGVSKYQLKNRRMQAFQGKIDISLTNTVGLGHGMPRDEFEKLFKNMDSKPVAETAGIEGQGLSHTETIQYGRSARRQIKPAAPIKKKIRIQYTKSGLEKFISHLDIGRVFELAARKASIPLVYSQGKTPHPKISFGPPLPVGIASSAEYLDLDVNITEGSDVQSSLNAHFPEGLQIVRYQQLFAKVPALSAVINLSDYEIDITGVELPDDLLSGWLAEEEIVIERQVRDEMQEINIRPYVDDMSVNNNLIKIRTRVIEGRTVRINEVVESLLMRGGFGQHFPIRRVGQYIEAQGKILTPFDILT